VQLHRKQAHSYFDHGKDSFIHLATFQPPILSHEYFLSKVEKDWQKNNFVKDQSPKNPSNGQIAGQSVAHRYATQNKSLGKVLGHMLDVDALADDPAAPLPPPPPTAAEATPGKPSGKFKRA
jgi:hypothetical protein